MQFSTVLSAVAFAAGTHAWAKAGNGEWIANNTPLGPMPYSGGASKFFPRVIDIRIEAYTMDS